MAHGNDALSAEIRRRATALAATALRHVQDSATGRVRVEDYLAVAASMTGEAALIASGVIDVESSEIAPGSAVFGDPINTVLSGDVSDPTAAPPRSVIGVLVAELVPEVLPLEAFGSLVDLYRGVAAGVGSTPWGAVALSVPDVHRQTVLPLQVAFELRSTVDDACAALGLPASERHVPCTVALADALRQVREAIDPRLALRLSLEIVFGTAKMMPMSQRAFAAAGQGQTEETR